MNFQDLYGVRVNQFVTDLANQPGSSLVETKTKIPPVEPVKAIDPTPLTAATCSAADLEAIRSAIPVTFGDPDDEEEE